MTCIITIIQLSAIYQRPADRDGPCFIEGILRVIPKDAVARRLLAEVVSLRAQAAEFLNRDPQVVACGLEAGLAPLYEHDG